MCYAWKAGIAFAMSLSMVGCGQKPGPTPDAATVQEAEATPMNPTEAVDVPGPLTISVRNEDGDALDADIFVTRDTGQYDMLTHVERPGPKTVDQGCQSGQRFQARPDIEDFKQGKLESCSANVNFVMYSVQRTFNIRRQGEDALEKGDLLLAQERLGLAADRYALSDPAVAQGLRLQAVAAAGRMLGVTDPVAVNEAPSEEFRQRLRTFQNENRLTVTGELDADTRNAISRMKFQNGAVMVPPTAEFQQVEAPLADPRATVPASEAATVVEAAPDKAVVVGPAVKHVLAAPVSAENAVIIRANRERFGKAAVSEAPAR